MPRMKIFIWPYVCASLWHDEVVSLAEELDEMAIEGEAFNRKFTAEPRWGYRPPFVNERWQREEP